VIFEKGVENSMFRKERFSLGLRIVISLIGTFMILAATRQMDQFSFGLMLFLLIFIAVSVAQ